MLFCKQVKRASSTIAVVASEIQYNSGNYIVLVNFFCDKYDSDIFKLPKIYLTIFRF